MFTFVEWEGKHDSNTNWLSYSVDLLLSHFQGKTSLEIKNDSTPKIHPLHYNRFNNNNNDEVDIDMIQSEEPFYSIIELFSLYVIKNNQLFEEYKILQNIE